MLVGLRDYVNRCGFPGVILGLSGGIDSHLSAAVAVDALGADRVRCVMLPSRYTSQASLDDAAAGARMLGVRYDICRSRRASTRWTRCWRTRSRGRKRGWPRRTSSRGSGW
jgi:NAD+ synthase